MSVSPSPIAIGANPCGARVRGPQDHDQKHERHDDFGEQRGSETIAAGGVFAVAVGGQTGTEVEAGFTAGDDVQQARSDDRAQNLCDDVCGQIRALEPAANQ